MDNKVAMVLAFFAGVVTANNWSKINGYVSGICYRTLSFAGLRKEEQRQKKKSEKTKQSSDISELAPNK